MPDFEGTLSVPAVRNIYKGTLRGLIFLRFSHLIQYEAAMRKALYIDEGLANAC